ncbi:MAG: lysophospholipid acyltransferase family protein [Clostridiales bacterium]|nr:lysophospholipid acyltransferase family protein [Clostridiales bacterium]
MREENKQTQLSQPKEKKAIIYTLGLPLVSGLFRTFLPVKYHGLEHISSLDAPFILMGNHTTMLDPVIMAVAAPKEQIRFVGKKELWKCKPFAWFANHLRAIPVDRHNTDMEAMRACMRVVREGHVLGIFPEGTRYHNGLMTELESGVAMIALRAKVPLVPVYIAGRLRLFRRLHVYVGKPIMMDDLQEMGVNTDSCKLLLGRITQTYAALDAQRPED